MSYHPQVELSIAVDRDFERAVLPFFAVSFPGIALPKARAYWDRRGIDLMTTSSAPAPSICRSGPRTSPKHS
jgi:hypothetical protein